MNRISSWRWIRLAGVPILATALAFSVVGWSSAAQPAKFPVKPVTIIVPTAAGGVNDTLSRAIAESMKKYFPQPVAVINKAGAGGIAGTAEFLKSPADGYVLESGSFGWSVLPTHLQIPPPYTVDQAVPVIQFTSAPSTPGGDHQRRGVRRSHHRRRPLHRRRRGRQGHARAHRGVQGPPGRSLGPGGTHAGRIPGAVD